MLATLCADIHSRLLQASMAPAEHAGAFRSDSGSTGSASGCGGACTGYPEDAGAADFDGGAADGAAAAVTATVDSNRTGTMVMTWQLFLRSLAVPRSLGSVLGRAVR